jgi:hypothetical protein
MDLLRQLLGEAARPASLPSTAAIFARLLLALLLGAAVAWLYRASRPPRERTSGFAETLLLLAPLIAMVTLAIGSNVAAAFTLVGTLAIVRFRTPVRDSRDTVFVIFAVAEGMAAGSFALEVALLGGGLLALSLLLVRALRTPREARAETVFTLRVSLSPPLEELSTLEARVRSAAASAELLRQQRKAQPAEQVLLYRLQGFHAAAVPALERALLELPEVKGLDFELRAEDEA